MGQNTGNIFGIDPDNPIFDTVITGSLGINTNNPAGSLHVVLSAGKPAIFGGDVLATVTGVTGTDATPTVLTVATTNGVAEGDAVIINSGTNVNVGTYWVASVVVDTSVTLDRNASSGGAISAASVTYVNDPSLIVTSVGKLVANQGISQFGTASGAGQVNITPASAIIGLDVMQANDAIGIKVDSESTSQNALSVLGKYATQFTQDISGGWGLYVIRNVAEAGSFPLVSIVNSHANNTQSTLFVDHNGTGGASGYGLHVDSENTAAPAVQIESANTIGLLVDSGVSFANAAEGRIGSLNIRTARNVHTLAAAAQSQTTFAPAIPSGALVLGASFTVNTAVTTSGAGNTWDADFITGLATALVAAGAAGAQNTKAGTMIVPEKASDIVNVEFDAPGAETFTGGVIEIIVYYIDLTNLADV